MSLCDWRSRLLLSAACHVDFWPACVTPQELTEKRTFFISRNRDKVIEKEEELSGKTHNLLFGGLSYRLALTFVCRHVFLKLFLYCFPLCL